jgi:hypothetical protein
VDATWANNATNSCENVTLLVKYCENKTGNWTRNECIAVNTLLSVTAFETFCSAFTVASETVSNNSSIGQ